METQQTNFTNAEQLTLWTEEQLQQASEGTIKPLIQLEECVQLYLPGFEPDEEVED